MNYSKAQPEHRNLVWFVIQIIARVLFEIWFRYRVRGIEHVPTTGAAMLLINHQSYLDPLLVPLWLKRPVCFLAREDLFDVPLVGSILRATYVIPINRQSPGKSSVRECIGRLDAGYLLGIFPEGTRTRDGQVSEFRRGFLTILRHRPVQVIPVGIAGADRAMPRGAKWIRPRSIRVVFGEPIMLNEFAELKHHEQELQLAATAHQRVVACHTEAELWRNGIERMGPQ